jgi:hypothetical protein
MGINNLWQNWLEAEEPTAAQSPTVDPNMNVVGPDNSPAGNKPDQQPQDGNVEDDPVDPDQDENDSPEKDFEQWRHDFYELSMKGDVGEMLSAIGHVIDREGLDASQRRFIEDNLQILLYRREANVKQATKEIRNLIKQDLDRTNPGTTVMQHLTATMEKDQMLINALLKCSAYRGMKGDMHRQFIAALLGAVQVGGGAKRQDLMYFDKEYTINVSTRIARQFGEVNLGKWSLKTDDPDRYLTEPEIDRLSEGSPEEKQTLRRRIIIESIAEKFKERAYLIHIVHPDGTVHSIGWDMGDSLIAAYKEGKIVIRGQQNTEKDAMISDTGEIVPLVDLDILFVTETGETDDEGRPAMNEVPFIERRDGTLYLAADLDTLKASSSTLSGMFFRETPYNGNPAEVLGIMKCIVSLTEMLNRSCGPE